MLLQTVAVAAILSGPPPHLVSPNEQTRQALLECATRAEKLADVVDELQEPPYSSYIIGAIVGAILLYTAQQLEGGSE